VAVEYRDYPVVEWTVYLKNNRSNNTAILQNIQGLDAVFSRTNSQEFVLNGIKGDWTTADSYEPYQITLHSNMVKTFSPPSNSGKSTDGADGWPYYDLQIPGGGIILAIGWPGQWASSFTRDATTGLRIQAGQQLTHLYLKPGEEIRTPLIAMLFWRDTNVIRAQNLWRRWYMAYNIPHFRGKPQQPITSLEVTGVRRDISVVKSYLKAGIKPDVCWRDAFNGGFTWYPSDIGPYKDKGTDIFGKQAWLNTGTWDIDQRKFPDGFKPFSDWIHARKMKFMLWFEPERVGSTNSWLARNHPEWLLPATDSTVGAILNEGNPIARNWLINHVDSIIKSQRLDWYREDMNGCGPLTAWQKNDAKDRQGITENFYVQGHLAYWDELKRRNPQLHIDSCASGGRRNDLETMRRAVPVTRSDFVLPTLPEIVEGNQAQTYGLSFWLPWQGSESWSTNSYAYRSFYLPGFVMTSAGDYLHPGTPIIKENAEALKKAYSECAEVAPFMLGDYYPLTPYNRQLDQWLAWQFNRPEKGDGMIQAFKRKNCAGDDIKLKLHDLEPKAIYKIKNFDGGTRTATGDELMKGRLTITISEAHGSAILTYKSLKSR
jgi:alpha-galactosidase